MKNLLANELVIKDIKQTDIAKGTGIPKATINNIVNQSKAVELQNVLKVVRYAIPHLEKEYMQTYLPTLTTPDRVIEGVEYTSTNRMFDVFQILLGVMRQGNRKMKQYAEVYDLVHYYQVEDYDQYELHLRIRSLGNKRDEFQEALLNILECYYYYSLQQYKVMENVLEKTYGKAKKFKFGYLAQSLLMRVSQAYSHLELKVKDNSEKARQYAQDLIDSKIGEHYVAYGHYIIGVSHMYSSYSDSKEHLKMASDLYKKVGMFKGHALSSRKVNLLNYVWNKDDKILKMNPNENDQEEALFLKGVNDSDQSKLLASLSGYIKKGDSFLARLPMNELVKQGMDKNMIECILNTNKAI